MITAANGCTASATATVNVSATATWFQDFDGDGFGNADVTLSQCTQPIDYVTNNTDCNDNNFNVHAAPSTPTISAGGATTFCAGGSVVLTSSAASGNTWSNASTLQAITVTSNGTYSVTVSNVCGSATSAPITVTVNPAPVASTISAGSAITFCQGGSVVLSGNVGGTWSTGSTLSSITVSSSGSYSITNANGCGNATSNVITVTVNTLPTPAITGDASFCPNSSATLSTTQNYSSYVWTGGSTAASINITIANTYSVNVTDANGCTAYATVVVAACNSNLPTGVFAANQCGFINQVPNGYMKATAISGAVSYLYSFYTVGGTTPFATKTQASINLYFGQVTTPNTGTITGTAFNWGTQYDVTVTPIMTGNVVGLPSTKCRFGFIQQPTPQNIPSTYLKSPVCQTNQPNASVVLNTATITCNTVSQANAYQFKFVNVANSANTIIAYANYVNQRSIAPLGLTVGATYAVSVRATILGVQAANFGAECYITIQAPSIPQGGRLGVQNTSVSITSPWGALEGLSMSVYPNPFTSEFTLNVTSAKAEVVNVVITDLTGKVIASQQIATNTNLNSSILNLKLDGGVYFVCVTATNGERKVMKVIKTN